jgi:DNA-binding CsgD family transcriptional regulator
LVDDLQWLDPATLDVLVFVARRLEGEPIGLLLAVRDPEGAALKVPAAEVLRLDGLNVADASAVLSDHRDVIVDPVVAREITHLTGGNPLAIIELARTLGAEVLAGRATLPDPLPVGPTVEEAFANLVGALHSETQLLLLAAAADHTDLAGLFAVATRLGVDPARLEDAESAQLITASPGGVEFRHPLVRSAVYRSASFLRRQKVHRAFADVLNSTNDIDRRLWHLAAATLGPDDTLAAALDASAARARGRGAPEAALLAYERAADLSTGSAERGARLVAAADAAWTAGRAERVPALLDRAAPLVTDARTASTSDFVRGRYETRRGDVTRGLKLLLTSSESAVRDAPDVALDMLLEAMLATVYAGDLASFAHIGRVALALERDARGDSDFFRQTLIGVGELFGGRPDEGIARLRAVGRPPDSVQGWLHAGHAAAYSGDPNWGDHYAKAVELARATGAVGDLPYALVMLAGAARYRGDFSTARIAAIEGMRLAEETGQEADACLLQAELAIQAAIRGDEPDCRERAERARAVAVPRRITLAGGLATWALGLAALCRGDAAEATRHLLALRDPASGVANATMALFSAPDLVEAGCRSGRGDIVPAPLAAIEDWAASGIGYARITAARSRAMFADSGQWEHHFQAALELEGPDIPRFERARTELAYGEALRRNRRPTKARDLLRAAAERFDVLGAAAWAERARAELRAAGETVGSKTRSDAVATLTAQELQIARMVAGGASNQKVAAALFLSPRTVEYHLYKVYPKLGISSRGELTAIDLRDPATVAISGG